MDVDDDFADVGPSPSRLSQSEAVISDDKPLVVHMQKHSTPLLSPSTDQYK